MRITHVVHHMHTFSQLCGASQFLCHLCMQVLRHYLDEAEVIILNRGAHYVPTPRFVRELRSLLRFLRLHYPLKLIIFRNTPPGHVNCTTHDRPLEAPQDPELLPPLFHWKDFKGQNEVARGIMREFGILYMDVYNMTLLRADGHRGHNRYNAEDCLHYCNPGETNTCALLVETSDIYHAHTSCSATPSSLLAFPAVSSRQPDCFSNCPRRIKEETKHSLPTVVLWCLGPVDFWAEFLFNILRHLSLQKM